MERVPAGGALSPRGLTLILTLALTFLCSLATLRLLFATLDLVL